MGKKNSKVKLPEDTKAFLKRCTNFSDKELKKWYQTFSKVCANDRMTIEQFQKIYAYFFMEGDSSQFATHVFRTFDKNGDGTIDFKEFMCGLSITMHGGKDEKLIWAFNMTDIDNSGSITKDELGAMIQSIYELMGRSDFEESNVPDPAKLASHLFEKLDKDSDGDVTLQEFISAAEDDSAILSLFNN